MHDTERYPYLRGLKSPWTVSRVHLHVTGPCVDVWAEHPEDAGWACPHGTKTLPWYDHAEERTWPSRQRPVPDPPARAHPTGGLRGTRGGPDHGAMGGATVAVHAVVRAPRSRRAEPMRRQRGHEDIADQLG